MVFVEVIPELANICLSDTIRQNADQGMLTGAVFVDLRKAFDSVNHQLLLSKLSSKGVNGNELEWFRNYLSKRLQTVCFNEKYSDLLEITVGVPQDSIVGPLLFTVFINGMPDVMTRSKILLFADDTVMFFSSKLANQIEQVLSRDIECLQDWLLRNKLFLHFGKTESLLFGNSKRLPYVTNFTVLIGNYVIRRVFNYKYLGVELDGRISWKEHVEYIAAKISKKVGFLKRIRASLTVYSSGIIYKSFVLYYLYWTIVVLFGLHVV